MTKISSDQYNPLDVENGDEVTLRSRWMIGVWQWWSRDVASHISQNILSTSYSLKPQPSLSFICWMTQPDTQTDTSSVSIQVTSIQTDSVNMCHMNTDRHITSVNTCHINTDRHITSVNILHVTQTCHQCQHMSSTQTERHITSVNMLHQHRQTHYHCQHMSHKHRQTYY